MGTAATIIVTLALAWGVPILLFAGFILHRALTWHRR